MVESEGDDSFDWRLSCSDGVAFLRLVSDRFDRRAGKPEKGEDRIVLRCPAKATCLIACEQGLSVVKQGFSTQKSLSIYGSK